MKRFSILLPALVFAAILVGICAVDSTARDPEKAISPRPLKALLIAGGCCHDYVGQHKALYEGIQARANVRVDVVWTRDKSTNPPFPLFDKADWAEGYDVIIHDECAASNKDPQVLENILNAHKTIPAVHLHCAMHSFRQGNDLWFKHIGLSSTRHGPQKPIKVQFTNKSHPIVAPLEDWVTGNEELYNNGNVFDAEPLAMGIQEYERGGEQVKDAAIVAWTNTRQGAKSFSTSLGHNTFTVEDPRYLDLVTRGLLWATGNLNESYLKPYTGSNLIHEITDKEEVPAPAAPSKDSIGVQLTASSVQESAKHYPWKAIDGDSKTRWTANGSIYPSWLQLEFEKPVTLTEAKIAWEIRNQWYQYKIETSADGKAWELAYDGSENLRQSDTQDVLSVEKVKFLKVTLLEQQKSMWPAIWEIHLKGPDGPIEMHPIENGKLMAGASRVDSSKYNEGGNIPPKVVKLDAEAEAKILSDVKVPEGFDVSLFAPWQMANYPVYVAASPSGDLYVSSDGNGSIGRKPGRGRVLRLRDTDQDGRADEVIEFIRDIDSPRGLIWDQDRLYLLHPPHVSVFFDRDHDGVAEESKRLISDIAFGFKDRPADHTTNGMEMGIDGWIYVAGGDFGFMNAKGTDGATLEHRGGGVIRFRPDGSGLELYSTGTRNILSTPMSPTLDMFSRDNTNDGGGWDVRFHHLTPLADHGYPRLYMNFDKEVIAPLADYGGGSGCGGVYIHEPGFPDQWNKAPYTVDWGRTGSFRHSVEENGGTFKETATPETFIKMTRPTDAHVDGMSAVYQASWKGPATFDWGGVDQGYVVRVTPKGYTPEPLPEFSEMSRSELVAALASASHIRTLAAQRALLRLGLDDASVEALIALINDDTYDVESRVAAVFALTQGRPEDAFKNVDLLYLDPRVLPFVIRALGDVPLASGKDFDAIIDDVFAAEEPRAIMEAIYFAVQQNMQSHASQVAKHLASKDPVIRHTAYRGLVELSAHEAAFDQLDSEDIDTRKGAAWALMRMHKKEVVDELISRLENTTSIDKRRPLISVLARLYHKEDTWTGDSWGTRPDTRGPYYTLTTWEQSDRILEVLRGLLNDAEDEEAGFTLTKLSKNRIPANDSLDRMIQIALADKTKAPAAVSQMANSGDLPEKAIPVVLGVAESPESSSGALADVVKLLIDSDYKDGLPAILKALGRLSSMTGVGKDVDAASKAFLNAPKLENHHTALENLLHTEPQTVSGKWAAKAVLKLAARKGGAPESREMTQKAIEKAWQDKFQKIALLEAARDLRHREFKSKILMAASDADKDVAKAAVSAARRLKIEIPKQVKSDGTSVEVVALLGQLKFDKKKIEIPVGKTIKLTLMNPDKMAHNLVIVQPGKEKEVAAAAVALGAEGFAKGWLPDHSAIIAATKMLNYDEDDTIEFKIDKAGEYPFICSFPGHELTMVGVIIAK